MNTKSLCCSAAVIGCIVFSSCSAKNVYESYTGMARSKAGLTEKTVQVDGCSVVYLEGGTGETVVLIHGFGAEKDYWTPMSEYMKGYHLIIPDLPGFGESEKRSDISYDVVSQADRIHLLLKTLGVKKAFIAGNSMGGNIAGIFAAKYPDDVIALGLLDNAGIVAPEKSDLTKMLELGINPLIVNKADDFDNLMDFGYAEKPYIPSPVKAYLAGEAIRSKPYNEKVWVDMERKPAMLQNYLNKLTMPVLIIWGDKDRIINVSCVPVMEKSLKRYRTHILKNCGHGPMMERPEETAGYIKDFLQKDIKML